MTEVGTRPQPSTHRVMQALRQAVQQRGRDYVYRKNEYGRCVYVRVNEDGQLCPDCGVGVVLAELGVPLTELQGLDQRLLDGLAGSGIDEVEFDSVALSMRVRAILAAFQQRQDMGLTWGQAYDAARWTAKLLGTSSAVPTPPWDELEDGEGN